MVANAMLMNTHTALTARSVASRKPFVSGRHAQKMAQITRAGDPAAPDEGPVAGEIIDCKHLTLINDLTTLSQHPTDSMRDDPRQLCFQTSQICCNAQSFHATMIADVLSRLMSITVP